MAVTANTTAPYAPAKAILDLVARHRDRGLPAPINADTLARAGISDSLVPRTLQAMQTLDLITEDGSPTPAFEGLRRAAQGEYQKQLQGWIKAAYRDVFSYVDPSKDSLVQIQDAFRNYQPIGQRDRMVTLFTGLCAAAGLMPEKPQAPSSTSPAKRSSGLSSPSVRVRHRARPQPVTPPNPNQGLPNSAPTLPPALAGLLASLPMNGSGWSQDQRDKFMTTFGAVIDFVIPIKTKRDDQNNEGDTDQ